MCRNIVKAISNLLVDEECVLIFQGSKALRLGQYSASTNDMRNLLQSLIRTTVGIFVRPLFHMIYSYHKKLIKSMMLFPWLSINIGSSRYNWALWFHASKVMQQSRFSNFKTFCKSTAQVTGYEVFWNRVLYAYTLNGCLGILLPNLTASRVCCYLLAFI